MALLRVDGVWKCALVEAAETTPGAPSTQLGEILAD
jgi:hypothetical protein